MFTSWRCELLAVFGWDVHESLTRIGQCACGVRAAEGLEIFSDCPEGLMAAGGSPGPWGPDGPTGKGTHRVLSNRRAL
jgi:hypothetical protein